MAKKKPVKKRRKVTVKPVSRTKSEKDHLKILLKFSEAQISGKSPGLDKFSTEQADRIRKQIEAL